MDAAVGRGQSHDPADGIAWCLNHYRGARAHGGVWCVWMSLPGGCPQLGLLDLTGGSLGVGPTVIVGQCRLSVGMRGPRVQHQNHGLYNEDNHHSAATAEGSDGALNGWFSRGVVGQVGGLVCLLGSPPGRLWGLRLGWNARLGDMAPQLATALEESPLR
jgi:hypothetical protein